MFSLRRRIPSCTTNTTHPSSSFFRERFLLSKKIGQSHHINMYCCFLQYHLFWQGQQCRGMVLNPPPPPPMPSASTSSGSPGPVPIPPPPVPNRPNTIENGPPLPKLRSQKRFPFIPDPIPSKPATVPITSGKKFGASIPQPPPSGQSMPPVTGATTTPFSFPKKLAPAPPPSANLIGAAVDRQQESSTRGGQKETPESETTKARQPISEDDFPCELCTRVFKTELELLNHLERAHPDGENTVQEVAEESVSENSKNNHSQTRTESAWIKPSPSPSPVSPTTASTFPTSPSNKTISVRCTLCKTGSKVFTTEIALFSHIKIKHPHVSASEKVKEMIKNAAPVELLKCDYCNRQFSSHSALLGHMEGKHGIKPDTAASITPSSSKSGKGPSEREVKDARAKDSPWWCNECDKGFGSNQALFSHHVTKHGMPSQSIPCPACKRAFPDIYSLKSHISMSHRNLDADMVSGDETYRCDHCVRLFIAADALTVHHQNYHPTLPMSMNVSVVVEGDADPEKNQIKKDASSVFSATKNTSSSSSSSSDSSFETEILKSKEQPMNGGTDNSGAETIQPEEVLFA